MIIACMSIDCRGPSIVYDARKSIEYTVSERNPVVDLIVTPGFAV